MNVYQRMVHERVSSALVFEDDADWDVSIKQQLVQFARGSRFIMNTTQNATPHSPYGDDWDILWIGHCGTWVLPDDNRRFFVIPDDPTVEPPEFRKDNVDWPKMTPWENTHDGGNRTRIVFHSEGAVCTAGYAISQKGARKALYHMSMVPYNSPVDWGLVNLCKNKEYNFTCISPWPQLVGVSRPTANTAKWSDIGYGPDDQRQVEAGQSLHLVYPMRQNIPNLLQGKEVFDSRYPDFAPPRSIKEIGTAVGHVEILEPEDVPVLG
jgi:GR25 family glycosyltransferase involved in LPS biosynthesis